MLRAPSSIPKDYNSLKEEYIGLASELNSSLTENEKLKHELAWFRRQIFGRKSERLVDPDQLSLEGLPEKEQSKPVSIALPSQPENKVQRAKPGIKPLPKSLPRRRVIHLPQEVEGHEDKFVKIGEDTSEELNYIPAKMEIIEHVYPKYKRKNTEEDKDIIIIQAPATSGPIFKGRPSAGLLAYILTSKWCDHLPLDRLVKIFKRQQVDIPKSTMVHWIAHLHDLLTPIYLDMKRQIISGGYVLADETHVQVLDKAKKGTSHRGYLWVYGDLRQVVYDYCPGRGREGPHAFLNGFSGYLQTDGYAGYNNIPTNGKIIHMGCASHARRKFFELKESEPQLTEIPLRLFGELFNIERRFSEGNLTFEERMAEAQTKLNELKSWLDVTIKTVLPSSTIAKAINYSLNQWDRLTVYHTQSRFKIDNNFSERCVKSAVIGRKNWLFFGSHEGGKRSATIYSLVESCKLQGHDPWVYLNDILSRLDESPMNINDLTPLNWKPKERG